MPPASCVTMGKLLNLSAPVSSFEKWGQVKLYHVSVKIKWENS